MDESKDTHKNQRRKARNKNSKTVQQKYTQTDFGEDESSIIDNNFINNLEKKDINSNSIHKEQPPSNSSQAKKKRVKNKIKRKSNPKKRQTYSINIVPKAIQRENNENITEEYSSQIFRNLSIVDDSSEIIQHISDDEIHFFPPDSNTKNPKYKTYQYFTTKKAKRAPLTQSYKDYLQKEQKPISFPQPRDIEIYITYNHNNENEISSDYNEKFSEQLDVPNYPVCKFCGEESLLNKTSLSDENEEESQERTLHIVAIESDDLENISFEYEEDDFYLHEVDADIDDLDSFRKRIERNQRQ